jgi:DNA modification methylase
MVQMQLTDSSTVHPPMSNKLYYGDNLDILRKKIKDETVDLCYIDPPFNSKRNYNQIYNNVGSEDRAQAQAFVDTWEWKEPARKGFDEILANDHGRFQPQTIDLIEGLHKVLKEGSLLAYLVSMTLRIVEIQRVLKPTGSFYLHCDPTSSHYLKLVLDGVFCSQGGDFQSEIVWKRTSSHGNVSSSYGNVTDTLLYYRKSDEATWNQVHAPYSDKYIKSHFSQMDGNGRRYTTSDLRNPGVRPNLHYEYKGYKPHPNGWAVSREKMEQYDRAGRLSFPGTANGRIRLKRYLDEQPGEKITNLWGDIPPINSQAQERLGYPTQKPEALLERIIKASSNEGDLVLDVYAGCGTSTAVAQRLNRQWIGIDITYQAIAIILKRMEDHFGKDIASAVELSGVPKDMKSAQALANKADDRVRKEFEKWAVLTYTNNRATVNETKGADRGIDGKVYFLAKHGETATMVFQVKSGGVNRGDIAKLKGDMEREHAAMATFITLQDSTGPMRSEARMAGSYHHELMGRDYDKIQIVTIKEMLENGKKRLDMPLSLEVLKKAVRRAGEDMQGILPGVA